MHGCPPAEIEQIARYMLDVKKISIFVKLNPTLLGYDRVREILDNLGYKYLYVDDNNALKIGEDVKSKSDVPIRDITSYCLTSSGMVANNAVVHNNTDKEVKSLYVSIPKSALSPDVTSKTIHSTAILMKIKFNAKVIAKAEFLGNVDARDLTLDMTLPCVVELDQDDKEE